MFSKNFYDNFAYSTFNVAIYNYLYMCFSSYLLKDSGHTCHIIDIYLFLYSYMWWITNQMSVLDGGESDDYEFLSKYRE